MFSYEVYVEKSIIEILSRKFISEIREGEWREKKDTYIYIYIYEAFFRVTRGKSHWSEAALSFVRGTTLCTIGGILVVTSLYRSLAFPSANRSLITALFFNLNVWSHLRFCCDRAFICLLFARSLARTFGTRNIIVIARNEKKKKFDRPSVESRNFFVYFVVLYRPRYLSSLFSLLLFLSLRDRGFRRDARARGQTTIISLRVIDRARSCDTPRERARLILNLLSSAIRA